MAELRLILMRHGQAQGTNPQGDRARALTERGSQQVLEVGGRLEALGWVPSCGVSSSATRTQETVAMLNQAMEASIPWTFRDDFYLGGARDIAKACKEDVPEGCRCLLLVGHNPGWSDLASSLSDVRIGLETAAAALLSIDAQHWHEAIQMDGLWQLEQVLFSTR